VASDELNEPFEAVIYARQESNFSAALEREEHVRIARSMTSNSTVGNLLVAALGARCSSKNPMVGLVDHNPNRPPVIAQGHEVRLRAVARHR
jgi:hypothetical protein